MKKQYIVKRTFTASAKADPSEFFAWLDMIKKELSEKWSIRPEYIQVTLREARMIENSSLFKDTYEFKPKGWYL